MRYVLTMGKKFERWHQRSDNTPRDYSALATVVRDNRAFTPRDSLAYGDHGLEQVVRVVADAIKAGKRIALYADYDVDGTMSCVSWIWFLEALGHRNFIHYIPCRFKEGYGLNLKAVEHLVEVEHAELVITMDTGITANVEAAYCKARGVEFICTDHHVIQPAKMPDCVILNPKMHPDAEYQELCGCGITFVLLRKLSEVLPVPAELWTDLLALAGMATICDVVPLNSVNHRLAKLGVAALGRTKREVLRRLRAATEASGDVDERDVGFRLGPRINAVGRLEHANIVIEAFVGGDPQPLVERMHECNERRRKIQQQIVIEARQAAAETLAAADVPILFLGGDWHPGVVGIAASKIAEEFWRPVWLFQRKDGLGKGSARSIAGFDVTAAMTGAAELFGKFGGHRAAGGFTFPLENESAIRERLTAAANQLRQENPDMWRSVIGYDCQLDVDLATLPLTDALDEMKPFGHGFEEPRFRLDADILSVKFFNDKVTGEPRHTSVTIKGARGAPQKLMFFNEAHRELEGARKASFVVSASRNTFRGTTTLSLTGHDYELSTLC